MEGSESFSNSVVIFQGAMPTYKNLMSYLKDPSTVVIIQTTCLPERLFMNADISQEKICALYDRLHLRYIPSGYIFTETLPKDLISF